MPFDAPYRPRIGASPLRLPALAVVTAAAVAAALWLGSAHPALTTLVPPHVGATADRAEALVARAQQAIAEARRAEGVSSDADDGTARASFLGRQLTSITTTLGSLEAKQLSTDPRWASALVVRLYQAGLRRDDVVAAGLSGSFPSLNLSVMAACQSLAVQLVAVSSVTASAYGANQPGFTWPEIERRLVKGGIMAPATVAVSVGGAGDRGLDLDPEGRAQAERIATAIASEAGIPKLSPLDFEAAIAERMRTYQRAARGRPIRLYVNVGGTEPSLGRSAAVLRLRNGFLPGVPFDFSPQRGLMARFAERGVPVLTLLNVRDLAARWGIL
jgi:poly-gamma-glutamate system protein